MQTIEAILEQARHLSVDERRRLVEALVRQLQTADVNKARDGDTILDQRQAVDSGAGGLGLADSTRPAWKR